MSFRNRNGFGWYDTTAEAGRKPREFPAAVLDTSPERRYIPGVACNECSRRPFQGPPTPRRYSETFFVSRNLPFCVKQGNGWCRPARCRYHRPQDGSFISGQGSNEPMSNTNSTTAVEKTPLQNVETVAGYNHPTGALPQAGTMPALRGNALKSIVAERLKAGRAKRAALRAAVLLKCFECSGYSAPEFRGCNCRDGALWVLRHNRAARKQEATIDGEK